MRLATPIVTLVLLTLPAAAALACPMCKDSIASGDSSGSGVGGPTAGLPAGFNVSIYLMLGGLFCVIAFVGYTIVRGVRSSSAPSGPTPTRVNATRSGFEVLPAAVGSAGTATSSARSA